MVEIELVELHSRDQLRARFRLKAGHVLRTQLAGGWKRESEGREGRREGGREGEREGREGRDGRREMWEGRRQVHVVMVLSHQSHYRF